MGGTLSQYHYNPPLNQRNMNSKAELISQASTLTKLGDKVLETETKATNAKSLVNEQKFHDFRISALSYLSRVFGSNSTYYESFKNEVTHATASRTRRGMGIIAAGRRDIENDWLETTRGTITKDILSDMLRIAKTQVDLGNGAAAVIMMGSVLEKLLRSLCLKADIKIYNDIQGKAVAKKGLQLTGEAYKKKLYDRQENKTIIGWFELYNDAVEGKNDKLTAKTANKMLTGLQSFLAGCTL